MRTWAFILFTLCCFVVLFMAHNSTMRIVKAEAAVQRNTRSYSEGVNNALDAIVLLDLEQKLQGTNRTWGVMADIVRERLSVEKRKEAKTQ